MTHSFLENTGVIVKFKFIPMLLGTLGFAASLMGAIALSSTPNLVMAQEPPLQAPTTNVTTEPKSFPPFPGLTGIELTPQQQEQIWQIAWELQAQFEATVPPPPQPTARQQRKIRQIVQNYRRRIEAVLTPEQLAQLRQIENIPKTEQSSDVGAALTPSLESARIELTPQQQEQIRQISEEMQSEVQAALPASAQITPEQEAKFQQLRQVYRERVEGVLNPVQQQIFRQNLEQLRPNSN